MLREPSQRASRSLVAWTNGKDIWGQGFGLRLKDKTVGSFLLDCPLPHPFPSPLRSSRCGSERWRNECLLVYGASSLDQWTAVVDRLSDS